MSTTTPQYDTTAQPIGEYVGLVAAKYGIAAIIGPFILMLIINFIRNKMCKCLLSYRDSSGGTIGTITTTVGLTDLSTTTDVIELKDLSHTVIADDSDDEHDGQKGQHGTFHRRRDKMST
jgi:hypothetical protein